MCVTHLCKLGHCDLFFVVKFQKFKKSSSPKPLVTFEFYLRLRVLRRPRLKFVQMMSL